MTARIAVLASGGGSNLGALFEFIDQHRESSVGRVVVVASDRIGAGALARARERNVPTAHLATRGNGNSDELGDVLDRHQIDLIVLAGYLRLVPAEIVSRFRGRIVNVHPALLPAFGGVGMYGARVHQAVLDAGATVSGATVHFVDDDYDRGPIIAQWPVPVLRGDTAETLAARVLRVEHVLYPLVVERVATQSITLGADGRVHGRLQFDPHTTGSDGGFHLATGQHSALSHDISRALGA